MEILSYFMRNPTAADSLEGIARWRLLEEVIHRKVDETHVALEWLVQQGFLLQTGRFGSSIFRLNGSRLAETERTLAGHAVSNFGTEYHDMPSVIIDSLDNAAPWSAFAPDGVTPSAELSIVVDSLRPRPNGDPQTAHVTGSANSLNHLLRRSLGPLDLTNFDELRLWINGERAADGTPARPFFLELRLGSVALPLGGAGNTWQRYLPVSLARGWEPLRIGIRDLPPAIRGAVTQIQLRSAADGMPLQCWLDDIIAVVDHMIADVDSALLLQLNGRLTLGGTPVVALVHPANGKVVQPRPYFEITNYDIVYSRERTESTRPRGDFSDTTFTLRPQADAYELYYQVTAVADDRATQVQMLEFLLRTLRARGDLVVNGFGLPMESIMVYPFEQLGGVRTDALPLFYRISTRQPALVGDLMTPVRSITVDGDVRPLA